MLTTTHVHQAKVLSPPHPRPEERLHLHPRSRGSSACSSGPPCTACRGSAARGPWRSPRPSWARPSIILFATVDSVATREEPGERVQRRAVRLGARGVPRCPVRGAAGGAASRASGAGSSRRTGDRDRGSWRARRLGSHFGDVFNVGRRTCPRLWRTWYLSNMPAIRAQGRRMSKGWIDI